MMRDLRIRSDQENFTLRNITEVDSALESWEMANQFIHQEINFQIFNCIEYSFVDSVIHEPLVKTPPFSHLTTSNT